ncbi:MAG TPA: RNA polymerase sigma factor [Phycisphaerae bacterium]|nr:RNA polymerase sigma factor [Phycisphaerae bacterium]
MDRAPTSLDLTEVQHLLLERAGDLRRFVDQKIPPRFKSAIAAEDVLQEVWISAFRTFGDYRPGEPGGLDGWLRAIARRRLADALRSAGALKRGGAACLFHGGTSSPTSWADLFAQVSSNEKTPSGEISAQEAANALQIALASLPEQRRQAVYLRLVEGRPREEVAQAIQKAGITVDRLVRQGLRDLRQRLRHASRFFTDSKTATERRPNPKVSPNSSDM